MSKRQERKRAKQNKRIAKRIVDEQSELLTGMPRVQQTVLIDGVPRTVTIEPEAWVAARVDQLPKELRDKYLYDDLV